MHITKFGHCCMLIEEQGLRILIDPGELTIDKHETKKIDVILITHEHFDHLHVPSVQKVLADSPEARLYTIPSVGELLQRSGVAHQLLLHGDSVVENHVRIEAFGQDHAVIHPDLPLPRNTGFFIADTFFYPGDAFTDPGKRPKILALPIAGPWMKISEAIDYACKLRPEVCFPVHDGIIVDVLRTVLAGTATKLLAPHGIRFEPIDEKGAVTF